MQLYFDNAATSFPKPQCVIDAMVAYQEHCGASPGRGAYAQAGAARSILDGCRSLLCELVHAPPTTQCIFTLNCTDSLNLAINGIIAHHRQRNEQIHIVTTAMDHNSVFRPLHAHAQFGVTHTIVKACPKTGIVDAADIANAITETTRLVTVSHGSNVTGTIQNINAIGKVCGTIPFLVDAAQTMGHTPIDVQKMNIDLLAFPGHKGLLGPLGTGGLIMRQNMAEMIEPLRFGGTGSASEFPVQPSMLPDKYEAGSHNMIGICGLAASVEWIAAKGVESLHHHAMELCDQFINAVNHISDVSIVGPPTTKNRCAVFSLVFDESPSCIAKKLEEISGVRCRAGLHCAPFAHETMGTTEYGGTVRVSFGPFHTSEDIEHLVCAIEQCTATLV
jgi:cysteine desulfurase/selenocysteine lyase